MSTLTMPRWKLTLGRFRLPAAALIIAALVALEEASQARFPARTLSIADFTASCVGIAGGTAGALALLPRMRRPTSDSGGT